MKKCLLFILSTCFITNLKAQICPHIGLYTNYYGVDTNYFQMDTTNLWQLGISQKIILNSPFVSLMTDTINNYPTNVNSSVIIEGNILAYRFLGGTYKVNTDTLTDYWTIYVSHDYGTTWYDLTDPAFCLAYNIDNSGTTFVKSGNSPEGSFFKFNFYSDYFQAFNLQDCDPILFKFQFVSDSIDNNKEGVQIWNLEFDSWVDFVDEKGKDAIVNIYPNPSSNLLKIEFEQTNSENTQLLIQNVLGQSVYSETFKTNLGKQTKTLDISNLQNGVYFIQLKNQNKIYSTKFIKR